MPKPPLPRLSSLPLWRARLLAWPGTLMLLSLLAMLLGHQPPPEGGTNARLTAGNVAPALPEVRPAPQPLPGPGLLAGTSPEPVQLPDFRVQVGERQPAWTPPELPRTLALLGRWQIDGG